MSQSNQPKLLSRTLIVHSKGNAYEEHVKKGQIVKANSGAIFVTFSKVEDCQEASDSLLECNIPCKFAHYKLFLKVLSPLEDVREVLKDKKVDEYLKDVVSSEFKKIDSDINVLNIKPYYNKEKSFIGCGEVTLDIFDHIKKLTKKEFTIGDIKFAIFRYRVNNNSSSIETPVETTPTETPVETTPTETPVETTPTETPV